MDTGTEIALLKREVSALHAEVAALKERNAQDEKWTKDMLWRGIFAMTSIVGLAILLAYAAVQMRLGGGPP